MLVDEPETTHSNGKIKSKRISRASIDQLRWLLASKRIKGFLEGFFAVLAVIYFVAAATFAGVMIGNALGS